MTKPLFDLLSGLSPSKRPIWLMRQAGRYLPEYREVRSKAGSFLDLCYSPKLAAEVTLQPLRRYDLDAAIVFADILLLPQALGCDLRFVENEGPKLGVINDLNSVKLLNKKSLHSRLGPVYETLGFVKLGLDKNITLIGFCGAPWTVASYMVEGGGSVGRVAARSAAFNNADWFSYLIDLIVDSSIDYLEMQVKAGADVVQIFDSWAGDLSASQLEQWVFKPIKRIVDGLRERVGSVPVIVFARGIGANYARVFRETMASAVGLDQGVSVEFMRDLSRFGIVQGNVDPVALNIGGEVLSKEIHQLLAAVPMDRHVFNLGHGVMQTTRPESINSLIEQVRKFDKSA